LTVKGTGKAIERARRRHFFGAPQPHAADRAFSALLEVGTSKPFAMARKRRPATRSRISSSRRKTLARTARAKTAAAASAKVHSAKAQTKGK